MTNPDTPTEPLQFYPVEEDSWMARDFAGSEPFADGSDPLYASGRLTYQGSEVCWMLVLDGNGGGLFCNELPDSWELNRTFASQAEAEAWFRAEVGVPDSVERFLRAGFHWV